MEKTTLWLLFLVKVGGRNKRIQLITITTMKKLIIFFTAILSAGILFAQKPYDPLTDPLVLKQESMMSVYAGMLDKKEAILKETPIGSAASEVLLAEAIKTKTFKSVFDMVAVKNYNGNKTEAENDYYLAKQSYYQIVWSKDAFAFYPKADAKVGFYFFKTC